MTNKVKLPIFSTWKVLKEIIGHPFSPSHTTRLMYDPAYADRRFPASRKIGTHRNSPKLWPTKDVLDYYKQYGLSVSENIEFS